MTTIYDQLCEVIPGGVNSPIRSCKAMGQSPMIAERGEGSIIYDIHNNPFIDYCGSWGALIHGHAHPKIVQSATARISQGSSFGITTQIEGDLARKIIQLVPSIEKIRFVSSGTEATMSAARLARGYTKRNLIIKFIGHYHGHADMFLVKAGSGVAGYIPEASSLGVPKDCVKDTLCLPFNDIETTRQAIRENADALAAVILEPITGNMGVIPSTTEFMYMLREETKNCGALLIFDEVITGFRVALGGAQSLYQIKPDLTCLGKIIGGGFPAAAFGGKKEIMDFLAPIGPIFQAGTLSGNPVAMAAGLQALKILEEPGFYEELNRKTEILTEGIEGIQQVGSMFTLFFGKTPIRNFDDVSLCNKEKFAEFFRYMYKHGVYIPPLHLEAWFVCSMHTDKQLQQTHDLIRKFMKS